MTSLPNFTTSPYYQTGLDLAAAPAATPTADYAPSESAWAPPSQAPARERWGNLLVLDARDFAAVARMGEALLSLGLRGPAEEIVASAKALTAEDVKAQGAALKAFRRSVDAALCAEEFKIETYLSFVHVARTDGEAAIVKCMVSGGLYRARRVDLMGYLRRRLVQVGSYAAHAAARPGIAPYAYRHMITTPKLAEVARYEELLRHPRSAGPVWDAADPAANDVDCRRIAVMSREAAGVSYGPGPVPCLEFCAWELWGEPGIRFMRWLNQAVSWWMRRGHEGNAGLKRALVVAGPPDLGKTDFVKLLLGGALGADGLGYPLFQGGLNSTAFESLAKGARPADQRQSMDGVAVAQNDEGFRGTTVAFKSVTGSAELTSSGMRAKVKTTRFTGLLIVTVNSAPAESLDRTGARLPSGGIELTDYAPSHAETSVQSRLLVVDLIGVAPNLPKFRELEARLTGPAGPRIFAEWRHRMLHGHVPDELRAVTDSLGRGHDYDAWVPAMKEPEQLAGWDEITPHWARMGSLVVKCAPPKKKEDAAA